MDSDQTFGRKMESCDGPLEAGVASAFVFFRDFPLNYADIKECFVGDAQPEVPAGHPLIKV
jgi:hypothetical protein